MSNENDDSKYAIIIRDKDGNDLFSIENRNLFQRIVYAIQAIFCIFSGHTLI